MVEDVVSAQACIPPPVLKKRPLRRFKPGAEDSGPQSVKQFLQPVPGSLKRMLPSLLPRLLIFAVIVFGINLLLVPLNVREIVTPLRQLVQLLIFVTAAYSMVIPKTMFWTIVFMWGWHLIFRIRTEGPAEVLLTFRQSVINIHAVITGELEQQIPLAVAGGGLGLITANFLSSNVFDNALIVIVVIAGICYIQAASKSVFIQFVRVAAQDVARLIQKDISVRGKSVRLVLTMMVAGMAINFAFILGAVAHAGYITGSILLVGAVCIPLIVGQMQKS